jgi:hypothetical protein
VTPGPYGSFVFGGANAFQDNGRCANKLPFGVSPVPDQRLSILSPTERAAAKLVRELTKELDRQQREQERQQRWLEQRERAVQREPFNIDIFLQREQQREQRQEWELQWEQQQQSRRGSSRNSCSRPSYRGPHCE